MSNPLGHGHQVYGRRDYFGETDFNMDIWRCRDRRMFVRFWSKDDDIDWRAFKVVGMLDTDITGNKMMGNWIPFASEWNTMNGSQINGEPRSLVNTVWLLSHFTAQKLSHLRV